MIRIILWCLIINLVIGVTAFAKSSGSGRIEGKVVGKSEYIQATLLVRNQDGDDDFLADKKIGDKSGSFGFRGLSEGVYTIVLNGPRLIEKVVSNIQISDSTVDIGMIEMQPAACITGTVKCDSSGDQIRILASNLEDGSSVYADENGEFIVDGLHGGKYSVDIEREGYVNYHAEVDVKQAKEFNMGSIKLTKCGRIVGKITLPDSNKLSRWNVTAVRVGGDDRVGYGVLDVNRNTGAYAINDLPPGKYNLLIVGPAVIVKGVSESNQDQNLPQSEMEKIDRLINDISQCLISGQVKNANALLAKGYNMQRTHAFSDIAEFSQQYRKDYQSSSIREILLLRVIGNKAIAFTRSEEDLSDDYPEGKKLKGKFKVDVVERWVMIRGDTDWKLLDYSCDRWLTQLLLVIKNQACTDVDNFRKSKKESPLVISPALRTAVVVTDDPRVAGIEVKSGETTVGHDWELALPSWVGGIK